MRRDKANIQTAPSLRNELVWVWRAVLEKIITNQRIQKQKTGMPIIKIKGHYGKPKGLNIGMSLLFPLLPQG